MKALERTIRPTRIAMIVAAAGLFPLAAHAQGVSMTEMQARYKEDIQRCATLTDPEAKQTCRREAGAAMQEARRDRLVRGTGDTSANAVERCQRLPTERRADCERLMRDGTAVERGSVSGGGVLREMTITVPVDPAAPAGTYGTPSSNTYRGTAPGATTYPSTAPTPAQYQRTIPPSPPDTNAKPGEPGRQLHGTEPGQADSAYSAQMGQTSNPSYGTPPQPVNPYANPNPNAVYDNQPDHGSGATHGTQPQGGYVNPPVRQPSGTYTQPSGTYTQPSVPNTYGTPAPR